MSDVVYQRSMSATEALMWRLRDDPHLSSTFVNVMILDRPPDVDLLRRRMERTAAVVPRLRQRVRDIPGVLATPTWVDDPEFAVADHVTHIALPAPGDERRLLDLAARRAADPFDGSRPLWHFDVVEGLAGGRAALVQKLHHTISDGEAGVELALRFLDASRDAPIGADVASPEPDADRHDDRDDEQDDDDGAAAGRPEALRELLAGAVRLPGGVARHVRDLLAEPERIDGARRSAAHTMLTIVDQLRAAEPARSPLWTARSSRRHADVSTASLAATKAAAARLGGTVNTAFLTIVADAAGRYHDERGAPVDALRATVAISTRRPGAGANAFTLVRVLVPTAAMPVADRFRAVDDAVRAAREGGDAPLERLATLAAALPVPLLRAVARRQAAAVDFATSNVRGAPRPVYVAGAKVLRNVPLGPLVGVAFNATLLSYRDRLDIGLHVDPAAVERPDELQRHLDAATRRFVAR